MKLNQIFFTCLFLSLLSFVASAQGQILESQTFYSSSLKADSKYSIYLPPKMNTDMRTYPIVYLLHGFTGTDTDWVRFGEIGYKATKAIEEGRIPPCIIVMPDGKNSWFVNSPLYGNYEDMLIKDLMPLIENKYGTPQKNARAIIGLSMGGNGAFTLAMKYPDTFGSSVALSGSFWSDDYYEVRKNDVVRFFQPVYGDNAKDTPLWKNNNPFYFLKDEDVEKYNSVRILFDCGDDDFVTQSQLELSNHLRTKGIKHELRIRDGQHNWPYWRETIEHALEFCAVGFRR